MPDPVVTVSSSTKIAQLQAFRFDSSSTVRITCYLDICLGACEPVRPLNFIFFQQFENVIILSNTNNLNMLNE